MISEIIVEFNEPYEWGRRDCLSLWRALARAHEVEIPLTVDVLLRGPYGRALGWALRTYDSLSRAYRIELPAAEWWRVHEGAHLLLRSGVRLDLYPNDCAMIFLDGPRGWTYTPHGLELVD